MTMISVRETLQDRFDAMHRTQGPAPPVDLSQGLIRYVRNPFYHAHPEAFPETSLREILRLLQFPDGIKRVGTHPDNVQRSWTEELQGITCDGAFWFLTQVTSYQVGGNSRLWKIPLSRDLSGTLDPDDLPSDVKVRSIPKELRDLGHWHFSDLDHHQGKIYVASHGQGVAPVVSVYDAASLDFLGYDGIEGGGAWCAVNPRNGLLYEAESYDDVGDGIELFVHRIHWDPSFRLEYLGKMPLFNGHGEKSTAYRLCGASFSPNGRLYIMSDDNRNNRAKIIAFEMMTGRRMFRETIKYLPSWPDKEEFEGLCFHDVDGKGAPGISGQIHVELLDNDYSNDDDASILHYKSSKASQRDLL